jgi:hypothetical protein
VIKERTLIADADKTGASKIKITREDGSKIDGQVWSLHFILWNIGKIAVKDKDILKPLVLSFNDPDVEILDYEITNQARPDISNAFIIPEGWPHTLTLEFDIIENTDAVAGQIIYRGKVDSLFEMSGAVEGVENIANKPPSDWFKGLINIGTLFGVGGAILFSALVLLSFFISSLDWLVKKSVEKSGAQNKLVTTIKGIDIVILLLGLGFLIIFGIWFTNYISTVTQEPPIGLFSKPSPPSSLQ